MSGKNDFIKKFKGITIRLVSEKDLEKTEEWLEFIEELVREDAMILRNEIPSIREEFDCINSLIKKQSNGKGLSIVAEKNGKRIGGCDVELGKWKQKFVATIGIAVLKEFRGIGLGREMLKTALKESGKLLEPKPKCFRLSCFKTNKPAIKLYKSFGFKQVAKIPKQYYHKNKLVDELIFLKETN